MKRSFITRHLTLKFWLFLCVCMFLVFMALYLFTDTPLRISPETTYITEPLTADGTRIDYMRAIEEQAQAYPQQMQTDENGCRILTRAVGPPPVVVEIGEQEQYYEKLGLPPNHTPTLVVYVDEFTFAKNYLDANPEILEQWNERCANSPEYRPDYQWAMVSVAELALIDRIDEFIKSDLFPKQEWDKQVTPVLDILAEAVRKPVFTPPYVSRKDPSDGNIYVVSLENDFYRNLQKSLSLRIAHRIDEGNIDGAIDDIITCCRLGRHVTKRGDISDYLTGNFIERSALAIGLNANPDTPPSEEQIKRFLRELDELPEPRSVKDMLNEERLTCLNGIQMLMDSPQRAAEIRSLLGNNIEARIISSFGYDWNTVMKHYNQLYNNSLDGTFMIRPSGRFLVSLGREFRAKELAEHVAQLTLCSIETCTEPLRRNQCMQNMRRIVYAMLLYEKEHGTLPPAFTVDAENRPLHSWRVLILPYLGEMEKKLYKSIRLDEPWNSEWNQQFHETQIKFYTCPGAVSKREYDTITEKGLADYTMIDPDTIVLAERAKPICWMVPNEEISLADAETAFDSAMSGPCLSGVHPSTVSFAFKSGRVEAFSWAISVEEFREKIGVTKPSE